jgi:GT2 family glycosyltransferase
MLSIVIINYDTRDLLRQCLESLREHAADAEVIVADNASRDGSAEMVRAEYPNVKLVRSAENLGFAGGNNLALRHATGDPILLLNSDTVVEDDSLRRCVAWLDARPDVGGLSPKLIGADGRPQQCAHAFPCLRDELRLAFRRPVRQPNAAGVTDGWLAGTALFLRRSALEQAGGGLDGGLFMYWEDCDLSARLRGAGWKLAVLPDAHVVHHGGGSGGGADATRRADLQAWYVHGKHRYFARHRGWFESLALGMLETVNVFRMYLRSLRHRGRRGEAAHARVLARGLWRWLWGGVPPRPGGGSSA